MKFNRVIQGDVKEIAKQLPDQCVNTIVTSPPYWGLRDYGTAEWIGGDSDCEHIERMARNDTDRETPGGKGGSFRGGTKQYKDTCPKCGATRKDDQIGLEPTPDEHVAVMVDVFRELRRVLRDDGTLWLNYGDCYASSINGRSAADTKEAGNDNRTFRDKPFSTVGNGLKPKDLVGMPWRIALALQADGWYLRSDIIWHKTNPMPESVTDRPTRSHEYIFLLSKSERYYYDADAIREPKALSTITDQRENENGHRRDRDFPGQPSNGGTNLGGPDGGRNKRTVWTVSTKPYREAHFATFPPDLIKPCILAGCPEGGIVLDPFIGSGTVAQVAIELRRQWLGIELNPEYINLTNGRLKEVQPMLFPGI